MRAASRPPIVLTVLLASFAPSYAPAAPGSSVDVPIVSRTPAFGKDPATTSMIGGRQNCIAGAT